MTKSGKLFCATKNRNQAITVTEFVNFPNTSVGAINVFQASKKPNIMSSHVQVWTLLVTTLQMICKICITVQTAARHKFHWEIARLFRFSLGPKLSERLVHRQHYLNEFSLLDAVKDWMIRPSSSSAEFSLCQTNGGATLKPANISDISKITKSDQREEVR